MKTIPNRGHLLGFVCAVLVLGCGPRDEEDAAGGGEEVSYVNDIQPIIENFCTTCHAGEDPEGDFVLTSYADVRKYAEEGKLLQRINDAKKPMPESGLMPRHLRRLFKRWADTGYLNEGTIARKAIPIKPMKYPKARIHPIDINERGFDLLSRLQGHWAGSMNLMGQQHDWMAFDYRAIAPSHMHGIFEGGTMGNLFTSFFVANYKGRRTIMARNGGILNNIYRTSYFVLDQAREQNGGAYYRLVDVHGGKAIMWMELTFRGDRMEFNAFTSRFGSQKQKRHMAFKAKQTNPELSATAARALGFPRNEVAFDFSKGLPEPDWGKDGPASSASYMATDKTKTLLELAHMAGDPIRIDQMPHLSQLSVSIKRNARTAGKKLLIYLTLKPLTLANKKLAIQDGFVRLDLMNGLLSFPEIAGKQDSFTFTYLHPGEYFLTVIADMNGDSLPSTGDFNSPSLKILVPPLGHPKVTVDNLTMQN